eukprot:15432727-Alexandrium_andersonii.AAC.1
MGRPRSSSSTGSIRASSSGTTARPRAGAWGTHVDDLLLGHDDAYAGVAQKLAETFPLGENPWEEPPLVYTGMKFD